VVAAKLQLRESLTTQHSTKQRTLRGLAQCCDVIERVWHVMLRSTFGRDRISAMPAKCFCHTPTAPWQATKRTSAARVIARDMLREYMAVTCTP